MSGITGIVSLDGQPAATTVMARLMCAIAHRGPDATAQWMEGVVGLGHCMLHTTPESLREQQPLLDARYGLCLTLDGRIDNRKALRRNLESRGLVLRSDTDAELVLKAYLLWDQDCAEHLCGDFAFAIWDAGKRTLFCARDPVGIKAFYYRMSNAAFYFSSELVPLLDTPGYTPRPNLGMMGEYLCDDVRDQQETLYEGILRLPPGHQLCLKDGKLHLAQYFRIDPKHSIRYASDEQYAHHFFEIFREAVNCRLRSQTPVSLFVSGGLDSSSILGMTHHLIDAGRFPREKLGVYSLLSQHPSADESAYLMDVANKWGDTVHSASMDNARAASLADQVKQLRDLPDFPNGSAWQPLHDMALRRGSRVTFWGFGGDEWLAGDRAHCADMLREFRLGALWRQINHDVDQSNIWASRKFALRDAIQWSLYPLVPHGLKTLARRHIRPNVPRWITPAFARRIDLRERLLPKKAPSFPTMAQRAIHEALQRGSDVLTNEMQDRFDARMGIEGRYPFYDRRLIEFALALPEDQRWRDDLPKFILRQAMRGLLPESLAQRKSKAEFSHLFREAIVRESADLDFASLRLCADGYVDPGVAQDMHARCLQGDLSPLGPVWMILALEFWYRMAFPTDGESRGQENEHERRS